MDGDRGGGWASQSDRRVTDRVPLEGRVRLRPEDAWGLEAEPATALNISSTGLFVVSDQPVSVGERLHCELSFLPRQPLDVSCRVVWVRSSDESGGPPGMGLAFEDLTDTRSERIETLMRRLRRDSSSTFLALDPFAESGTWAPAHTLDEPEQTPPPLPFAVKLALVLSAVVVAALLAVIALLLSR